MPIRSVSGRVKNALLKLGWFAGSSKSNVREESPHLLNDNLTLGVGRGVSRLARDAASGTAEAVEEIRTEASGFAKDIVIGAIEGTRRIGRLKSSTIREAVSGTIQETTAAGVDVADAGRSAVEGAIEGATSSGIASDEAADQALQGAMHAARMVGADLREISRGAVSGVISGVAATGGDVMRTASEAGEELVANAAAAGEDVGRVALNAVEGAIDIGKESGVDAAKVASAVAIGAIDAAYEINEKLGQDVQRRLAGTIKTPIRNLAPSFQARYSQTITRLSGELEEVQGGWRFRALWTAGRSLFRLGGFDLAAALAYFTLLSFFPLIALVLVIFATFADSEAIRARLLEVLLFYFPSSQEFLDTAINHIFDSRIPLGIIAFVAMVIGANGLFMAANRSINRIFDCRPRKFVGTTLVEVGLIVAVFMLFLASLTLTVVFQVVLSLSEALPALGETVNRILVFLTGAFSVILPFILAALVFAIVYRTLPNRYVSWKDATFGGVMAVLLFEVAKHLFFWFTALSSQRNLLYGTLASVILLLIWSHVAGLIFLYGAALTRESATIRPDIRE